MLGGDDRSDLREILDVSDETDKASQEARNVRIQPTLPAYRRRHNSRSFRLLSKGLQQLHENIVLRKRTQIWPNHDQIQGRTRYLRGPLHRTIPETKIPADKRGYRRHTTRISAVLSRIHLRQARPQSSSPNSKYRRHYASRLDRWRWPKR